jgi:hypothetical protein
MSSVIPAFRTRTGAAALQPAEARERAIRRRVGITWGLMVLNCLTYSGSLLGIPTPVGKAITQGALPIALLLALSVNRRVILRPNVFLCLVSLLVVGALLTVIMPQHLGTVYRTFRLAEFVAVLWLLTPWWGRRDMLLVHFHRIALWAIMGSVFLGVLVAPSYAAGGRLSGVLWGIPPTEVAHYAAILLGLVLVPWLCGEMGGRYTLFTVAVVGISLVLTHTRTALVAVVAGLLVAMLSMIVAKARVRKFFAIGGAAVSIVIITLSSFISTWLARGEGSAQLSDLTGRTKVWGPLLAFPRDRFQEILGFGLSNSSFNGLPIDSNWLASYEEQGLLGVVICATMLLFLLVAAYFQPRGVQRALALFLVTYCLVASFTEVGFTDASMYLLDIYLAASLLVPAVRRRSPV